MGSLIDYSGTGSFQGTLFTVFFSYTPFGSPGTQVSEQHLYSMAGGKLGLSLNTDGVRGWIDDGTVHTHAAIPVSAGYNAHLFRIGASGFDVQVNGGSFASGSFGTWSGGTPALIFGNNPGRTFGANGFMSAFAVFNERVSDDLAAKLYDYSKALGVP